MSGIALCFVVGEETDSLGARGLLDHLPNATYLVNGEPTGNKFVRLSWGAMDVVVTFNGISRHSSLGTHDSAIHGMISALVNLEKSAPSKLSINIGLLSGGTAANTTAPLASARLCVRYSLSTAECIQFLSANLPTKTFECLPPLEPLSLYVPDLHLTDAIEVKFGSDASIFHKRIPHVMMRGPGSIQFAHTDQEQINRNELHEAIRDLVSLSELLLG
jgi:acetylornithine deacetylase